MAGNARGSKQYLWYAFANVYSSIDGRVGGPLLTFSIFSARAARSLALSSSEEVEWLSEGGRVGLTAWDPLSLLGLDDTVVAPRTGDDKCLKALDTYC